MLKNHLKVAFRSLFRQKSFSLINILGLAVGLTCSLLILLWVQHQYSYNTFHSKSDSIFQMACSMEFGGDMQTWQGIPYPYSPSLQQDYPEIEEVVVKTYNKEKFFRLDNNKTSEKGFYTNEPFFQVFDFPILYGNPLELLNTPDEIVLSEKLAKKYFGNLWQSAVGNTIVVDEEALKISGIFANVPNNSSMQFDFVLPITKHLEEYPSLPEQYGDFNYPMFVQLKKGTDKEALIEKFLIATAEKLEGTGYGVPEGMILQPLTDVYLFNQFENGKVAGGRINYVRIFFLAALFILFLAGINYMNLATARASKKAKEIGVRKTIGASKGSLIVQFFTEAMVMTGIAISIAIVAIQLLLPWFNQLVGTSVSVHLNQPSFWILTASVFMGLSLLAGIYPALLLSSFNVSKVIKGQLSNHLSTVTLRKGLVVFQFLISALLIIGAITMRQQLHYLQTCLLYTSPSPRDATLSRMPSSA